MASNRDIGAQQQVGIDIGAQEAAEAAPPVGNAGIMTTNTGFWGPTFIILLGLLALFCWVIFWLWLFLVVGSSSSNAFFGVTFGYVGAWWLLRGSYKNS